MANAVAQLENLAIADNNSPQESADQAPSLANVLQHIDLRGLKAFFAELPDLRCIASLRLTCPALRDFADANIYWRKAFKLQLREDGTVSELLAALERFRGSFELDVRLPAAAPAGVDALLPATFTALPEPVRRRVTSFVVSGSGDFAPGRISGPAVSGAAVGGLAASLPCLRALSLVCLPWTWSPGDAGEAYADLAALGTLEALVVPCLGGLTGVEALAGSLRRLSVLDNYNHPHELSAFDPLSTLMRLEELHLYVNFEGLAPLRSLLLLLPPSLRTLRLLPPSLRTLRLLPFSVTLSLCDGRLAAVMVQDSAYSATKLAVVARQHLLPCLEPGGRLQSLSVEQLALNLWGGADMEPLLELFRRSDSAHVERLHVGWHLTSVQVSSALAALGHVRTMVFPGGMWSDGKMVLDLQRQRPLPSSGPCLRLPKLEEIFKMALRGFLTDGAVTEGGAVAGGRAATVEAGDGVQFMLLVRGPAAAAALDQARHFGAEGLRAWARELEPKLLSATGDAFLGCLGPLGSLISGIMPLSPASAVLLECRSWGDGAAEAVVAATPAASQWEGSEAVRVQAQSLSSFCRGFTRAILQVVQELWAASAGEGGPGLQQRVDMAWWAVRMVQGLLPIRMAF